MQSFISNNSPPVIPLPRQPSPLSFSSLSFDDHSSSSHTSMPSSANDQRRRSSGIPFPTESSSANVVELTSHPKEPHLPIRPDAKHRQSLESSNSNNDIERLVPVRPLPDSLVLRTTLNQLENQTIALKRSCKSVLAQLSHLSTVYDQLEKAEDDLLTSLGELARWLGHGYGLKVGLWDEEQGVRELKRARRKREREDLEVMVAHGIEGVKVELKRRGLAGGGAHAKFDRVQQQYYNQTASYLAPQNNSSSAGPSSQPLAQSTSSASSASATSTLALDAAQAARTAQFEVQAYQHQSALLFAVPPSSTLCLDLLVGLYSWAGTTLGERPRSDSDTPKSRSKKISDAESVGSPRRLPLGLEAPVRILSRTDEHSLPRNLNLHHSLGSTLEQLAQLRSEILQGWALRDTQLNILETDFVRKQAEVDGVLSNGEPNAISPISALGTTSGSGWSGPVSSHGLENKKGVKRLQMHKIHRSVGGRLRDLLSSSNSSMSLASTERGTSSILSERPSRASFDGYGNQIGYGRGVARPKTETVPEGLVLPISSPSTSSLPFPQNQIGTIMDETNSNDRQPLATRHSLSIDPSVPSLPVSATSPDLNLTPRLSSPTMMFGGLAGLDGTGDEDERREMVGRKKEGVLWGLGSWEGLSKAGGGRSKWEMMWVVLDHSSIYEYRGIQSGQPDAAHAVIDLKFASVREGRNTDRRFVFEIVTAKEGRRLYQATSDAEMKTWLYAIANAIESCINGTSSVRTFDTSKLRTSSGALDDHAIPTNPKRFSGTPKSGLGIGFPIMANRRSMPPPMPIHRNSSDEGRTRKTSLKKVWRQGAEIAGEKWSNVTGGAFKQPLSPTSFALGDGSGARSKSSTGNDNDGDGDESSISTQGIPYMDLKPVSDANRRQGHLTPPLTSLHADTSSSPASNLTKPSTKTSWFEGEESADGEIEKRVLEMAGLGLGLGLPTSPSGFNPTEEGSRRIQSEGIQRYQDRQQRLDIPRQENGGQTKDMTRSKSADETGPPLPPKNSLITNSHDKHDEDGWDMRKLREIAGRSENSKCADCGKGMKSSRWATVSLHEQPLVLFLCIRCCGLHRGLGTHISKPRSVDLDHWTRAMIKSADDWGNVRGNNVWERKREGEGVVSDEDMGAFIKAKYVEGRWLSGEDRLRFGLDRM